MKNKLKDEAATGAVVTGQLNVLYYDISTSTLRKNFLDYLNYVITNHSSIVLHAYHDENGNLSYATWVSDAKQHQYFLPQNYRVLKIGASIPPDISKMAFYFGDQDFDFSDIATLRDMVNADATIKYIDFYPNFVTKNGAQHLVYYIFTDTVAPLIHHDGFYKLHLEDVPNNVEEITGSTNTNVKSDPSPPASAR